MKSVRACAVSLGAGRIGGVSGSSHGQRGGTSDRATPRDPADPLSPIPHRHRRQPCPCATARAGQNLSRPVLRRREVGAHYQESSESNPPRRRGRWGEPSASYSPTRATRREWRVHGGRGGCQLSCSPPPRIHTGGFKTRPAQYRAPPPCPLPCRPPGPRRGGRRPAPHTRLRGRPRRA